jgi:hypothetical protein
MPYGVSQFRTASGIVQAGGIFLGKTSRDCMSFASGNSENAIAFSLQFVLAATGK